MTPFPVVLNEIGFVLVSDLALQAQFQIHLLFCDATGGYGLVVTLWSWRVWGVNLFDEFPFFFCANVSPIGGNQRISFEWWWSFLDDTWQQLLSGSSWARFNDFTKCINWASNPLAHSVFACCGTRTDLCTVLRSDGLHFMFVDHRHVSNLGVAMYDGLCLLVSRWLNVCPWWFIMRSLAWSKDLITI